MKNFTPVWRSLYLVTLLLLSYGLSAQDCVVDPANIIISVENTCADGFNTQAPFVTVDFGPGSGNINGDITLQLGVSYEQPGQPPIIYSTPTVNAVASFGFVSFRLPGFVIASNNQQIQITNVIVPGFCNQNLFGENVVSDPFSLANQSLLSVSNSASRTIIPPCSGVSNGRISLEVTPLDNDFSNGRLIPRLYPESVSTFISVIPPGSFPNTAGSGFFIVETSQNIPAGDYAIVIYDTNADCEVVHELTLGSSTSQVTPALSASPVTCFGDTDGSIAISANPGNAGTNGPVTYILLDDNDDFVRSGTINATSSTTYSTEVEANLPAGDYTVNITTVNGGCMSSDMVTIGGPDEIVVTGIVAPTICADAATFDLEIGSIMGAGTTGRYRLIDGSLFDSNVPNNSCWTRPSSGRDPLSSGANGDGTYTFTLGTAAVGFCRAIDQDTTVSIVLEVLNTATGCTNQFPFTLQIDAQPDTPEVSHSAMAGGGEITGGFYCSGQDITIEIADYDPAFTYDVAYTDNMDVTGNGAFAATMFTYTGTGSVVGSFDNPNNGARTIDFTVTKENNATGCVSEVEDFSLSIRPLPVVDPILNDDVIVCSNEEFESDEITLNDDGGNGSVRFDYEWSFDPALLSISGAISDTDLESEDQVFATFTNTSGVAQVATLTITPTFPQNSPAVGGGQLDNACEGESSTITVTVSPRPTLSYDLNIGGLSETLTGGDVEAYEICNGDDFQLDNLMIPEDHAGNKAKYVRYRVLGDARFLQINTGGSNFDLDDVQTTQFLPIANFAIGQPNIQNNHPNNNAQVAQIILVPYFEDEVGGPDFPLCRGEAIRIFLTLNPTAPALMSPQTEIVCSDERIEYTIDGASGSGGNLETRITETNVFSGVTDDFYVVPEGADRIENFSFTISGANGGGTIPGAAASRDGGLGGSVSGGLDENELEPGDTIRIRKGLAGAANTSNGNGGDATLLTVTRPGTGLVYTFVAAGGGGAGNGEDGRNARTFTMDPAGDGAQGQGPGGFGGTGNPDARGGDGNVNGGGGGGGYVGGNGGDSQSGESGQGGASFRSPVNELATFSVKASDEPADGEASIFYTVVYDDIRFSLAQPVDVPTGLTPVGETIVDGEVDTILFGQQFVNMTNEAIDVTYLFNTTTEANCNDGGQVEVVITVEPEPTASIVSGGTTVTGDAINGFEATVCSGDPIDAVLQSMTIPSQGVGDLRFMVDATFSGAGVFGNNSGRASSGNFDGFYTGSDLDIPFFETGVFNNNGVDGTITYNITPVLADNGSNFPGSSHNNPLRSINYCEGQTFTFTVTVEPGFTADLNPGQFDVCSRETLGSAPFDLEADQADDVNVAFSSIRLVGYRVSTMDPNFTAVSIVDTTGLSSGGVILTQAGNYFENDTYRNLTGAGVTVEYDIILISDTGCESQVITYEFLIRAEPVISTMGTEVTVCEGEPIGLRTFPASNSAFEASWTNTSNVTFTYDLDPGNLIYLGNINYPVGGAGVGAFRFQNDAFENPTSVPQTATYTVFATTRFGCVGDPVTYTVTVLPDPELTADIEAGGISETLVPQDDLYIYELCSGDDFSLGNLNFTSIGAPGLSEYVEFSIFGGEADEFLNIDDTQGQGLLLDASGFLIGSEGVQNTSPFPYLAFITLTPYLESDTNNPDINGKCVGESIQILVILNPEVTGIPTPQPLTVCSEEPIDFTIDTGVDPLFSVARGSHDFANGTDFVFPDNAAFIPILLFEASSADGGDALNNENTGASGLAAEGAFNIGGGAVIPGDTLRAILGQPGADGVMTGAGGGATSIAVIGGPNRGGAEGLIIEQIVIGGGGGAGALEDAENNFPFSSNVSSADGADGAGPGGNGGSGAPTFAGGTGVNNGGGGGGGWVGGEGGNSLSGSAGESGTSFDSGGFMSLSNKDGMAGAGGTASITYAIAFDDVIFTVTGKDVPAPLDASGAQLGVGDSGLDTLLNGETFVNNSDEAIVVTYTLSTGTEANCPGGVVEINVTVEPNPTLSLASDATMILEDGEGNYSAEICSGDSLSAILSSMTIPSTGVSNLIAEVVDLETGPDISFNTSNGSRASGPNGNFGGNNFPAQADVAFFEDEIINIGTSAQQVVYTVVPSISRVGEPSCIGDTIRLTVTVYPEFVGVDVAPSQVSLCSNVSLDDSGFDFDATQTITNMIAFDSIIIDTVYNNVSLANAANFETISSVYSGSPLTLRRSEGFFGTDTYRNRTGAPAIVTYKVRLVSGPGCFSDTITYNFRYTAEPVISLVETASYQLDTVICNLGATGLVVNPAPNSAWSGSLADFNNNVDFEFDAVVPMGVILTNGTYPATGGRALMSNDVLENTTDGPLDVVYTVSPSNNGCAGDPVSYTVTVNPNPDATVELTSLDSTATFSLENSRAFLNPNPAFGMCSGQALTTTVPAAATSANGTLMAALTITEDDNGLSGYIVGNTMVFPASELGDSLSYAAGEIMNLSGGLDSFTVVYTTFFEANGTAGNQNDGVDCGADGTVEFDVVVSPANVARVDVRVTDDGIFTPIPSGLDTLCSGDLFDLAVRTASTIANDPDLPAIDSFIVQVSAMGLTAGAGTESTDFTVGTPFENPDFYFTRLDDLSFTNPTAGIKTVRYIATPYSEGCAGVADTTTISFRPEIDLRLTPSSVCTPGDYIFTAEDQNQASSTSRFDYDWTYVGGTARNYRLSRTNDAGLVNIFDPATQGGGSITFDNRLNLKISTDNFTAPGTAIFELSYNNEFNCTITETLTMTIGSEVSAGIVDQSIPVQCEGPDVIVLENYLTNETPDGTWERADAATDGVFNASAGTFVAQSLAVSDGGLYDYDFRYIVGEVGSGCDPDTATITVQVQTEISAGTYVGTPIEACQGAVLANLFDGLNGEESGGSFVQLSGTDNVFVDGADGIFDQTGVTPGTYVYNYVVAGRNGCPGDDETVVVEVLSILDCSVTVPCDTINLLPGFSVISFSALPQDATVENIFADDIANNNLLSIFSVNPVTRSPEVFSFNPVFGTTSNTIGAIRDGFGYIVEVDQATTIITCGVAADTSLRVELISGLNIVGYTKPEVQTAIDYFSTLTGNGNLNQVRTVLTETGEFQLLRFNPLDGNNILMQTSQGYLLDVNADYAPGTWRDGEQMPTSNFDRLFGYTNIGNEHVGEYIRLQDADGNVYAKFAVESDGTYDNVVVFGDLSETARLVEGFAEGEEIFAEFRGEVIATGVTFAGTWNLRQLDLNFNATIPVSEVPVSDEFVMDVFPNPTEGETKVNLTLDQDYEMVRVEVYGLLGQVVAERELSNQLKGQLSVDLQLHQLPAGTYVVRVLTNDGVKGHTQIIRK